LANKRGAPGGIISLQGGGIIQESLGAIIPLQTGGFVGIGTARVNSGQRLRMRSMMAEALATSRTARAKRKSKPPMTRGMDGCNDKKSTTPLSLTQKR
jgi:hypothetical protein